MTVNTYDWSRGKHSFLPRVWSRRGETFVFAESLKSSGGNIGILSGGDRLGSPNPDSISDQNMVCNFPVPFQTLYLESIPVFRHLIIKSISKHVKARYCIMFFVKIRFASEASNPRGELPYERGGDARRTFWIKPLKETTLGVAQAFLTP